MAVSREDVRHIGELARLGLTDAQASTLAGDLNTILHHMEALADVDCSEISNADAREDGMPLRADAPPPDPLLRPLADMAPSMRDGFFLVPRLATHETGEES